MRRDWSLVRQILLQVDGLESSGVTLRPDAVQGYDTELVSYHFRLLDEAGLIRADCAKTLGAPLYCLASSLTWSGHELLDQIRRETVWNRTLGLLRERGLDVSLHALKTAAARVVVDLLT